MTKKKSKTKSVTLAAVWENIKGAVALYLASSAAKRKEGLAGIRNIAQSFNASPIPESISANFIRPYLANTECQVKLVDASDDGLGSWPARLVKPEGANCLLMDPVGVYSFISSFKNSGSAIKEKPGIRDDFREFRQLAFMNSISKMPEPYFFYLAVLQEIAVANDIVSIENRDGGYTKSDASCYLSMLWAFKEFERFYLRIQHRSLRADYGIIWHEGEWIQERRTRGYA